jgi:hypothetical protein
VTRHLCTECRLAENAAAGIKPCVAHAHPANACKICSPCVPSFTLQAPAHAAHTAKVARSSKSVGAFMLRALQTACCDEVVIRTHKCTSNNACERNDKAQK